MIFNYSKILTPKESNVYSTSQLIHLVRLRRNRILTSHLIPYKHLTTFGVRNMRKYHVFTKMTLKESNVYSTSQLIHLVRLRRSRILTSHLIPYKHLTTFGVRNMRKYNVFTKMTPKESNVYSTSQLIHLVRLRRSRILTSHLIPYKHLTTFGVRNV